MAYLQGLWGIVFLFLIKNLVRLVLSMFLWWKIATFEVKKAWAVLNWACTIIISH